MPPPASESELFTHRRVRRRKNDHCFTIEPHDAAHDAGLKYVTDADPGYIRQMTTSGAIYLDLDGEPLDDSRHLARIEALVIPPAWTDVWICARPDGHLQATGRDARGRKQYRYHPRWREVRDETKFGRLLEFGQALPIIRERVDADLRRSGLPREKVVAAVVRLLEKTLIRVGNEEYTRSNASYGLTTLRDDHVQLEGSEVRFTFRGKSGKDHEIDLRDRRLARIVGRCRDLPGQVLFQYEERDGTRRPIGSSDVNAYLRDVTGQDFTAKDFRTWFGTVLAACELVRNDGDDAPAQTASDRRRTMNRAINLVAERLGNTPAICRRCYIHPRVIETFESGRLTPLGAGCEDLDYEALVLSLLSEND